MTIRAALGAGKARLIRQMLTESVVLSCCGATLGLLFAFLGTRVLAHLTSVSIPLLSDVRMDFSVVGFTALTAILTGILFGLFPAFQVPSIKLHDTLKDSNRGSSQGHGHAWIRSALVVSALLHLSYHEEYFAKRHSIVLALGCQSANCQSSAQAA
jgi:predicted lysophospholipase L1 biosynthesis ABC-type transport system permease subunit